MISCAELPKAIIERLNLINTGNERHNTLSDTNTNGATQMTDKYKCPECENGVLSESVDGALGCSACSYSITESDAEEKFKAGELTMVSEEDEKKFSFGKKKDDDEEEEEEEEDMDESTMNRQTWAVAMIVESDYKTFKAISAALAKEENAEKHSALVENTVKAHADTVFEGIDLEGVSWDDVVEMVNEKRDELKEVREDLMESLGSMELDESAQDNVALVFESAVRSQVGKMRAVMANEYRVKLSEAQDRFVSKLEDHIDPILEGAIDKWFKDNEVVLESNIRLNLAENFIDSLVGVFNAHYVEIPEDRVDVVESLNKKVKELNQKLSESAEQIQSMKDEALLHEKAQIVSKLSEGLTDVQSEKFNTLIEDVEFNDAQQFIKRLTTIKESFISNKSKSKSDSLDESTQDSKKDINEGKRELSNDLVSRTLDFLKYS